MNDKLVLDNEKIARIIRLCESKIEDQHTLESTAGYADDYNDGRIVGQQHCLVGF